MCAFVNKRERDRGGGVRIQVQRLCLCLVMVMDDGRWWRVHVRVETHVSLIQSRRQRHKVRHKQKKTDSRRGDQILPLLFFT